MTYPSQGPPNSPQRPYSGPPYSAVPVSPGYQASPTPQLGPPGERPAAATAAGIVIMVTVAMALVAGACVLIPEPSMRLSEDERIGMFVFGTLNLVTAFGFIALALGVLRGRNGARITAFVVYSAAILLNGCVGGLILVVEMNQELPWQAITFTIMQVTLMFSDVIVIVLLAQGNVSRWFRAMGQARRLGTL